MFNKNSAVTVPKPIDQRLGIDVAVSKSLLPNIVTRNPARAIRPMANLQTIY